MGGDVRGRPEGGQVMRAWEILLWIRIFALVGLAHYENIQGCSTSATARSVGFAFLPGLLLGYVFFFLFFLVSLFPLFHLFFSFSSSSPFSSPQVSFPPLIIQHFAPTSMQARNLLDFGHRHHHTIYIGQKPPNLRLRQLL